MPKVALFNIKGEQVGDIDLNDSIFGVEVNSALLHEVVNMQLANRRQGTQATKTRAMVSGGGKKPWRQKGTGRARAGSSRSPLWTGGGVTFGPMPRSYRFVMPRKMRRLAIKSALSSKFNNGDIIVVESLNIEQPKTRVISDMLVSLKADRKAVLVTSDNDINVYKSARNIENITSMEARNLNVYDILNAGKLVLTKDAIAKVEEVFA